MNYPQFNPYQQYNPIPQYQQRIEQMQQMQPQQEPQQNITCRPVASVEEARGVQTDFSGALMVFPDVSHGMIHTKRLDFNTGSAVFNTYRLEQRSQDTKQVPAPTVEYAPMSEIEALKTKIAELEDKLTEKPKAKGAADK